MPTQHEVEFTTLDPPVPIKYCVPLSLVSPRDEVLAPTPQCYP